MAAEATHSPKEAAQLGSFRNLLFDSPWNRRALLGMALAAVGLATFWSVTVAGKELSNQMLLRDGVSADRAAEQAKFAYGIVETTGVGLGLLSFGPLRRGSAGDARSSSFNCLPSPSCPLLVLCPNRTTSFSFCCRYLVF